jgi:hypothetical protein
MTTRTALVAAALAVLAACAKLDTVPQDAIQTCNASQVFAGHVATDILFVVDDSGSMNDNQTNLANNLGAFIDRLASLPIEDDYQIGVTTTDVQAFGGGSTFAGGLESGNPYPQGALIAVTKDNAGNGIVGDLVYDAAAYPATHGWGGPRILPKGSPTLIQDFKANVRVGTSGSSKEQPFRAIQLALTDRIADGTNAGFLRPGAKLAIVILSDEDDCSDTPPLDVSTTDGTGNTHCHTMTPYKDTLLDSVPAVGSFLVNPIQGEQRDVVLGAIVGVAPGTLDLACTTTNVCNAPPPTCTTCCGAALDRGDRFHWLLDALGPARTRLASICDANFGRALEDLATAIMSDTMPLDGAPADWRMLVAKVTKASGGMVSCRIASDSESSAGDIAAADAIYTPPQMGGPSLTFQGGCALSPGDRLDVAVICAG